MAICTNPKYVGKNVILEYAIGCGDVMPSEDDWNRLGSMRTKEFSTEWDTTDVTADDSVGSLRESLATFQTLSMSGDGIHKVSGVGAAELKAINMHVLNPIETGGQPFAWFRITFPDITIIAFMLVTSFSRAAPYDDAVTYSLEATATASDFGIIVEDTPTAETDPVASIAATPSTLSLEVGDQDQVSANVLPVTAPQSVTFSSSASSTASVNSAGVVTGVGVGTATITVRSVADSTKTATVAVTVTAA